MHIVSGLFLLFYTAPKKWKFCATALVVKLSFHNDSLSGELHAWLLGQFLHCNSSSMCGYSRNVGQIRNARSTRCCTWTIWVIETSCAIYSTGNNRLIRCSRQLALNRWNSSRANNQLVTGSPQATRYTLRMNASIAAQSRIKVRYCFNMLSSVGSF
jgi:hypothetical protein